MGATRPQLPHLETKRQESVRVFPTTLCFLISSPACASSSEQTGKLVCSGAVLTQLSWPWKMTLTPSSARATLASSRLKTVILVFVSTTSVMMIVTVSRNVVLTKSLIIIINVYAQMVFGQLAMASHATAGMS